MEPMLTKMTLPKGFRLVFALLGLLMIRIVVCIVVVIVLFFVLGFVLNALHFPGPGLQAFLLPGFLFMMGVFASIDFLTVKLTDRHLKLPPLLRSIGCFAVILILTLTCGIIGLAVSLGERPFSLSQKSIADFEHQDTKEGIAAGVDLYLHDRLNTEVFRGNAVSRYGFIGIELIAANSSKNAIEIAPTDFSLKYSGQPVGATVIGYETAARRHLDSLDQAIFGPAAPHEVVLLSPLIIASAPRVYTNLQRWRATLHNNEFEYGKIVPSQTHHGFVYFEVKVLDSETVYKYDAFKSPDKWGLAMTVHRDSGESSLFSFAFGE